MPYTVGYSFDQFNDAISLGGDHEDTADARRKHLVGLLEKNFDILDSFATGSVPKGTALLSHADLDVIVVLHYTKHIKDRSPSAVLASVQEALSEWRTGVRSNGQAVTLHYKSWPNVDIVPVSRTDNDDGTVRHYNVPNSNTETWIRSRPRAHAKNVTAKARECGDRFLALVRMVKEWNRVHSELLSSYHIEVMALQIMSGDIDEYTWSAHWFFSEAAKLAASPLWYEDAFADEYLDSSTRAEAVKRLKTADSKSLDAWLKTYTGRTDHEGAITLWRQIFGDRFPAYG